MKMKKVFIIVLSVCLTLPAFSQDALPSDDPYAKFQGIWHNENKNENYYFIFINNTVTFTGEEMYIGTVNYCTFTLSSNKITFCLKRVLWFSDSKWQSTTPDDEGIDGIFEADYIFSGDKLILIFDGEPFVLQKMD
jgi:hypothetical protein